MARLGLRSEVKCWMAPNMLAGFGNNGNKGTVGVTQKFGYCRLHRKGKGDKDESTF